MGGPSPVIARYRGGTNIESKYSDAYGRSLTLDEVIEDVARSDGSLHGADEINYRVFAGGGRLRVQRPASVPLRRKVLQSPLRSAYCRLGGLQLGGQ
ncbi:hypothetical protein Slala03_81560 [Streptomyces lavendulae subsp. lavendulae]|nr:hypothetical protein Slala03_81560 [Streptomyces lavendulae subsp. lavendulae]